MPPVLRAGSATDVGRVRQVNEDQYLVAEHVYAVADGMGGHQAGEVASLKAVEALRAAFVDGTVDNLVGAVQQANRSVFEHAEDHPETRGMGTTLAAMAVVTLDGQQQLAVANVGDSRAYLLRDGELTRLTEDHSLVEELVREGQLTPDEALVHPQRSTITRALGIGPDVEVDVFPIVPYRNDRILLCSDGLTNELSDDEIASTLRQIADPDEAARDLVDQANGRGGNDNITVVVVDVVDWDDTAREASAALADDAGGSVAAAPPPPPTRPVDPEPEVVAARRRHGDDVDEDEAAPAHRRRRVSFRVVAFLLAVVLVIGAALAAVGWYARRTYYVGFQGDRVAIFQGRPGGLLWFDPTLEEETPLARADVPPAALLDLEEGKEQTTLEEARSYVDRMSEQARRQRAAAGATTTTAPPAPPPTQPAPAP